MHINPFDWFYQVGNVAQEGDKKVLKDLEFVNSPEAAIKIVKDGEKDFARRFRCEKDDGIVDEEWYDPKIGGWI